MSVAIIAEKPSVARDIAQVLGATRKGDGCFYGSDFKVSWALGHLVVLPEPHEIDPSWKAWRRDRLPMLPDRWPLQVIKKTKSQFRIVEQILRDSAIEQVICATDAGREGELIFRYVYEKARCNKPVMRLWISSLTPSAIRRGMANLKSSATYDDLAAAARGRSQADWLVGMNLSRAYTLAHDENFSVGRVQTPTLAMIVERTKAIQAFVPEAYIEVAVQFSIATGTYIGVFYDPKNKTRLPPDGEVAEAIAQRALTGEAEVETINQEVKRRPPLLLYDLTELQRHANRLFGFSAQKTLQIAQSLYEKHKVISYPRTDSRHLTEDVAGTLDEIVNVIRGPYEEKLAPGTGKRPLSARFVNDARVTDHHAIIPTSLPANHLAPGSDEFKIYDIICRRLLAAWHDDYVASVTTVTTRISSPSDTRGDLIVDRYRASGTLVVQEGWKVLDPPLRQKKKADSSDRYREQTFPSGLNEGDTPHVDDTDILNKKTKPPRPFTEATLLTAMETAGKTLEDKALSDAMRENGLGTPATRAATIETLLAREYIFRKGKALNATDKGIHLIEVVDENVRSPGMTGLWERRLKDIERGRDQLDDFMTDIHAYIREVVGGIGTRPTPVIEQMEVSSPAAVERIRRVSGEPLDALLHRAFGFDSFRPHQEEVCRAVTEGESVLLVMPTGAGKSLCYQLPGIARGGTTLVISPLIALMEDQTAALRRCGFVAERIHSGMSREASREVCRRYLLGALDFLFIAPERLGVTGFPEMLAKRMPALIAVDEAHCISHWGHDFRPDYRMLKERLTPLRSAPVIAMTATATPLVQKDIIHQLDMPAATPFIHGFRRTNIAIEVTQMPEQARGNATAELLADSSRRPAIVYAPTRKKAEALAAQLAHDFPTAAYHAGMKPAAREQVQADFLGGRLEVIVATIAFGMGIDKSDVRTVVHVALPSSIEGYYQEMGRVGRDGLPSRAVLLYTYADIKTHEFFLNRDYPQPSVLSAVHEQLTANYQPRELLQQKTDLDDETLGTVLEKLWIHGGAAVNPDESVSLGDQAWRRPYLEQRRHKEEQLELVNAYAQSLECRMLRLVRHFGDQEDTGEPCDQCDICLPNDSVTRQTRAASETEQHLMVRLLGELQSGSAEAKGKLYREIFEDELTRNEYEALVEALFRAKLIKIQRDSFNKGGQDIEFQRLRITRKGYRTLQEEGGVESDVEITVIPAPKRKKPTKKKRTTSLAKRPKGSTTPKNRQTKAAKKPHSNRLVSELKEWRLALAQKRGIPAFRILSDRTLNSIAADHPLTEDELLNVSGVGKAIMKNYGKKILAICNQVGD